MIFRRKTYKTQSLVIAGGGKVEYSLHFIETKNIPFFLAWSFVKLLLQKEKAKVGCVYSLKENFTLIIFFFISP